MNYRSVADLSSTIAGHLDMIPRDVDVVVGIPRSGLLAGNLIALAMNLPLTDLAGFIDNRPLSAGTTRVTRNPALKTAGDAAHALVVDDSILSGSSLALAKESIAAQSIGQRITYCAVYATDDSASMVDVALEIVPRPRAFEWNIMHHPMLADCYVDIDGVLCVDPTDAENDDGPAYENFLVGARPLTLPSYKVGHLVTSRLEKYRAQTEDWLAKHAVSYGALHMLDLPDAATRRRLKPYAEFKATVYKQDPAAKLFIESDDHQAYEIAQRAGMPALCWRSQIMVTPGMSLATFQARLTNLSHRAPGKMRRIAKRMFRA